MKQFFKMTLATVCGIAIVLLIAGFFLVISLAGMLASESAPTKVQDNSVFVIKLSGTISERAESGTPLDAVLGMEGEIVWYDLSGRRLEGVPTEQGIFLATVKSNDGSTVKRIVKR